MGKGEHITRHATSGIVNWVCSRVFPAVNVAQMEMGLSDIFLGWSTGTGRDQPRVPLPESHGKGDL